MQQYPLWKTLTLVIVTLIGAFYALPNLYGQAPSVQIATASGDAVPANLGDQVAKALAAEQVVAESSRAEKGQWIVRFGNPDAQLKAVDTLKQELGQGYVVSLNL